MFKRTAPSPDPEPTGSDVATASDHAPATASNAPVAAPIDQTPEQAPTDAPEPAEPVRKQPERQAGLTGKGRVRQTRVSALYIALVVAAILAIFLLIFIAQNSAKVSIQFLGFEGQVSLAVALLLSAVIGILVVAVPGSLRIVQLRHALRKNAKH